MVIEPKAQLTGFMIGHSSRDLVGKEDDIEVMKFECSKKDPGLLDFLKR